MKKIKLVIAGNYSEYLSYLADNNISPVQAKYISSLEDLKGVDASKVEVVYYGSYAVNPVYGTIELFRLRLRIEESK